MKITELAPEMSVSVESSKDEMHITLETTVCKFDSEEDINVINRMKERYSKIDFCFLEGIHEEEFLIDFTSPLVRNDIVVVIDRKPWAWKNVRIMNLTLPVYGRVHVVMTTSGELPHNRRDNYRLEVEKEGELLLIGQADAQPIIVRDISASGVGIIVHDIMGIEEGSVIRVNFEDIQKFYLSCKVRRIKELAPKRFLVGAEFEKPSEAIAAYISVKQRKKKQNQRK